MENLKLIPEQNWKRVSKTLDFILSHPADTEETKPVLEPVKPSGILKQGLLFDANLGRIKPKRRSKQLHLR